MIDALMFAIHGLIGAFLATLFWAKEAKELASFEAVRNYVVGFIAGYIYFLLSPERGLPGMLMAVVFGYFGKDLIESLFERLRKPSEGPSEEGGGSK